MLISIIVAISENGIIGRGGQLPWRLADDLRHFKQLTLGYTVIMGRRTWESIGRPLPGRHMLVISRQPGYAAPGCQVVGDLAAALDVAQQSGDDEAFVIGGAEIYRVALPLAERLYLTRVHAVVEGDTRLPELALDRWQLLKSERREADERNDHAFSLEVYQRK